VAAQPLPVTGDGRIQYPAATLHPQGEPPASDRCSRQTALSQVRGSLLHNRPAMQPAIK
jgi:hypothetical protein